MREIKFRAWEKFEKDYAKEMGSNGEMHYGDAWKENEELQEKRTVVIAGFYHDSGWDWNDFEIMQFTGLKDKNGKEIYEGDILKRLHHVTKEYEPNYYILDVFEEGGFWARTKNYGTDHEYRVSGSIIKDGSFEIVGNVYENKELSKVYDQH